MANMSAGEAPPMPKFEPRQIPPGLLQAPLSRLGRGPGIILLVPDHENQPALPIGVPSVLKKWAEEGYVAVELTASADQGLTLAVEAIHACAEFDGTSIGIVAYSEELWNKAAANVPSSISGVVVYADHDSAGISISADVPVLRHIAGGSQTAAKKSKSSTTFSYPGAKSHRFALPTDPDFNYSLEAMAHTRTLSFLKPLMGGPHFDLEAIWEEHTFYEFADRSVEHTMSTMVDEPYVNHVPTLTGGIGRSELSRFYAHHFIFQNPEDSEMEMVSRTVGIDRVVDEFICKFTHDRQIDWALPGIPPTGKRAEIPMTAIVNIRGDRLYHEHIAWDQASLLRQLGLLPEYLPWPYALPGKVAGDFEYRVPAAGIETAQKLRDRTSLESNQMFSYSTREVKQL